MIVNARRALHRGAALLAVAFLFGAAQAQDSRARVQGIVTDPTHAVVAGAVVRLHNDNTGVESVKQTNDVGLYVFDLVDPGTYSVLVEHPGFSKFVQQNVIVQVRGDVTVDATLGMSSTTETVNVSAAAVGLQFNTSTMEQTVNGKMLNDLPIMQRNPFTLALLDPAVVNRYGTLAQRYPFYMWSSSELDVGGSTSTQNDLQLDGAPLQLGWKGSYNLPMDAVQEFSVQQNSVDAEFGHSAGGVLSIGMKSGTNSFHGTAYYFGRNPALNAVTNSVTHTPNLVRNNIWGGTLGNPIVKNKLFSFFAYEQWHVSQPFSALLTLPTALERTGDFSQSFNGAGAQRVIYDPWSTQFNSATGAVSRTPFVGNRIPNARMDPSALIFLKDIWQPNGPGDDATGVNNFKTGYVWFLKYLNISQRTDWNVNDKWKIFGRYSRFHTTIDQNNYTPNNSPAMPNDNGGVMYSQNMAGDAVYTMNNSTVLDLRFSYATLNDDYNAPSAQVGSAGLAKFWPNNPWYQPYLNSGIPAVYYPNLNISTYGSASFGKGGWWYQHPQSYNYSAKIAKYLGKHDLKVGGESRLLRGFSVRPNLMSFNFGPAQTANTFLSPNTRLSGDGWATFLLGALDSSSSANFIPLQQPRTDFYAGYVQDDIKLTRNLTLNLGLRYEFETGLYDAQNRLSRYLDLTNPIPEMQSTPPPIPADVAAMRGAPYIFNGAWIFTDSSHRSSWNSNRHAFAPRVGMALRLNDRTVLRAGFARYIIPPLLTTDTLGSAVYPGFSATTTVAPVLQGVPQSVLSDPFPSTNPLILPVNKTLGRYTNLGSPATWNQQDFRSGVNDRLNVSIQHRLPGLIQADITYFVNLGRSLPYSLPLNMTDPNLIYTDKAAVDKSIPNPFYHYLTPDKFQGQLRNLPTVSVRSLLSTYPQYGALTQVNTAGVDDHYQALQIKLQRTFSAGYMFLIAYNYNNERTTNFFNDIDQYADRLTWIPSNNPRHRLSAAGTYELPIGKGRRYLSTLPAALNAVIGGWSTSSILFFNSGDYLRFGAMQATGDPTANPTPGRAFDITKFAPLPAYTPRTNPWQYPGLVGPLSWELDSTVSKIFPIKERLNVEFKFEAYNLTNSFVPTDPVTDVQSSLFGRSINQANRGREMQYTLRLIF
ncbi:MAG TPA: TonB-dependent receptor [Bryobacteraceae bacterium]|nr:TonB-dependent receptor [Bryobacteraceae bacterium]